MEDEEIVDIIAKYLQTTLAYVLPHVSENIIKNKTEGGTEHWLCNVYIYIMKRFFYVDSLNFVLVAGISFSLRVAGAQNKANLDVYVCASLVSYLYNLIPIVVAAKMFL